MKSATSRLSGKMSKREIAMILTTTMDRLAVNALWRGKYDDTISKGITPKDAAAAADRVIRRTQPMFSMKDVPDLWRAGEVARPLLMFQNQLNQYWNYYWFDIVQKTMKGRIGKVEALKRVFLAFVLPSLMIGAITRSELPKDAKETVQDLAGMAFSTVPIFGQFIASGMKGFRDSSGPVMFELFDRIQTAAYYFNKEEWDKVILSIPEIATFAAGIPTAQPFRTMEAIINIASGKSNDWLELIWGEYTRKKLEGNVPTAKGWQP